MKKLLIFIPFILLGCTSKPKIELVHVPVYHQVKLELPSKPNLAIENITNKSQDLDVLKAYGRSIDQLINYSNTLVDIILKNNELQSNDTENKQ